MAFQIPSFDVSTSYSFSSAFHMRVREQLNHLDSMMFKETGPSKLDRLASAQAKGAEQERILDGRPLPGSRKPLAESARCREKPRIMPTLSQPAWRRPGQPPAPPGKLIDNFVQSNSEDYESNR